MSIMQGWLIFGGLYFILSSNVVDCYTMAKERFKDQTQVEAAPIWILIALVIAALIIIGLWPLFLMLDFYKEDKR